MQKIIFVGGAPCTGKSHLATALAKHYESSWISTDTIREMMKTFTTREKDPDLFLSVGVSAEEYLVGRSPKEIAKDEFRESFVVQKAVKAFIDANDHWDPIIIEGVAITPAFVQAIRGLNKYKVEAIFLVDHKESRIRESIYTRGLWDDADKYPDSVKPIEVEWVKACNAMFHEQADFFSENVLTIQERRLVLSQALELLGE